MKRENKSVAAILRQKDEGLLKKNSSKSRPQLSESEKLKLIHELEVHQIELKMQNEELVLAKEKKAELTDDKPSEEVSEFAENIINTVREPLLVLDQELRVVKASRSFYNFFKVSSGETIGKLVYDLGNQQWDIPKLRELLETILPEKTTFDDYEVEHDFSTIGKRVMLLNARQIKRAFGKEKIILLAIEDITERKLAEELISEKSRMTSEYLDILLNYSHAPIIIWDSSLIIRRFNHEFEKLTSYKSTEVIDKKIDILFPEDKIESTLELLNNHLSDEKMEVIEIDILTKNKEFRTVLWNSANIFDQEGTSTVATIAQDITRRKNTEEALRISEEKYRRIFENVHDVYYEALIDGTILEASPSIGILSKGGYHRDDLIGKSMYDFYSNIGGREALLSLLKERGSVTDYEISLKNRDCSNTPCSISAKIIFDDTGKPLKIIGSMHDITERKQSEKEITMLAHSLRSINECISITDLDDKILFVNESFLKTYGYEINELLGKNISLVRSQSNEQKKVDEILPDTILGEWEGELLNRRKDGTEFPIYLSTTVIKDKEDRILGLIGVATNISERKRAEETLLKLSSAVEQTADSIMITDREGTIEYVNHAFEILTGFTSEEAVGKTPRILKSGIKDQNYYEELWKIILSGKVFRAEFVNKKKNGDWYDEEITISPIFDKNKTITHFIGTGVDISERKKLELNFLTAAEIAKLGYWEYDVKSGNFIFNDQYYRLIHGSSTEKQGGNRISAEEFALRLVHPDDSKMVGEKLQEAINSPDPNYSGKADARVFSDNGDITNVVVQFKVQKDYSGRTYKIYGINQDVTEQKRFENELIAAKEKAEESDRLKSAFLANMSHEVRTPLNSIIGFSELLADPDFDDEQKNEFIQHIITNGNSLLTIISDIMDISKMESGEIKIRKSQINALKFISGIKEKFASQAEERKLELKLILPDNDIETVFFSDIERLRQIFNNLMSNAIKFTAHGSIELGYQLKGRTIEFFVRDTGIGIPAEYHDTIFERFRQVETSTTRKYGGNGLGLAICKKLVELMGGKIWLESDSGKGSVFYFTLPTY